MTYLAECGFEETASASVQVLSAMLNRPKEEVEMLLQEQTDKMANSLHPSAMAVAEAYQL